MDKLAELSKTDLLKRAHGLASSIKRQRNLAEAASEKIQGLLGGVTAGATGFAVGLVETKVRNPDGTPLSLGPVPLALATGAGLSMLSLFFDPMGQVKAAACGSLGAYGATMGRGWAMKKATTTPVVKGNIVGMDWNDDEAAIING